MHRLQPARQRWFAFEWHSVDEWHVHCSDEGVCVGATAKPPLTSANIIRNDCSRGISFDGCLIVVSEMWTCVGHVFWKVQFLVVGLNRRPVFIVEVCFINSMLQLLQIWFYRWNPSARNQSLASHLFIPRLKYFCFPWCFFNSDLKWTLLCRWRHLGESDYHTKLIINGRESCKHVVVF